MKILVQDNVLIITGKEKGKQGKVLRSLPALQKIVVEKINVITKHIKKSTSRPGQKIQFEKPIAVSNVKLICPNCNKATRVSYKILNNQKKMRFCPKCQEGIPNQKITKKIIKTN